MSETTDLGAATVVVEYDPALLSPTACRPSSAFDVTLCNPAYDGDKDGVAGGVRFTLISLDGVTVGISPTLLLAEIVWTTTETATVGGSTVLSVAVDTFTDTAGLPMAVTAQSGLITFIPEVIVTPTPAALYLPARWRDAEEITPTPARLFLPFLQRGTDSSSHACGEGMTKKNPHIFPGSTMFFPSTKKVLDKNTILRNNFLKIQMASISLPTIASTAYHATTNFLSVTAFC